jgi:hypothetical protein
LIVGLAVGGVTAPAQGWLPDNFGSLANSAGPWALVAFLVALTTRRVSLSALGAALALMAMEIGYAISTVIRGGSNSSSTVAFWLVAALIAGPAVGVAAAWTRSGHPVRTGLGIGLITGVLVGEGIHGLTAVADTTYPPYWIGEIAAGAVVLVVGSLVPRKPLTLAAALGSAAIVAAVVVAAAKVA